MRLDQRTVEGMTGMALVAASFIALGLIAGCAESSATATIEATQEPIDAAFVEAAEHALGTAGLAPEGWEYGIVMRKQERPWALALVTRDGGGYVLNDGHTCAESSSWSLLRDFMLLVDPGDLIKWSHEGDDNRVCSDEIELVRKAVAR